MKRLPPVCLLVGLAFTGLALCSAKVSPPPRKTALEVCELAMRKAYEWDHEAQLIFVTSRPAVFQYDGRASKWGFRCVSADGAHVAAFSIDMAHPSSPVRVTKNVKRPPTCLDLVNRYKWKIDSPEACAIAKRNGLDAWLAKHPTFDPTYSGNRFELAANKSDGPYWLVSCSAKRELGSRKYDRILLTISATSGQLLSRSTTP